MSVVLKWLGIPGIVGIIGGIALGLLLLNQTHQTHVAQASATRWEHQYAAEHIAHQQTIINYKTAAETARKADAANVLRVEQEDAAVSRQVQADYEKRIAAARDLAQRLHREVASATAHPGSPGTATVPGVPVASSGPSEAAGQDKLSGDDALTATEQAIQLDELIKWIEGIHAVDVNGSK